MPLPDGDHPDDHHLPELSHPLPDRARLPGRRRADGAVLELQRALVRRGVHRSLAPPAADPARGPVARAVQVPRPGRGAGRLVAWLVLTLVVLLVAAALAGRNEIAARLPRRCRSTSGWGCRWSCRWGSSSASSARSQQVTPGPAGAGGDRRDRERLRAAARRAADPGGACWTRIGASSTSACSIRPQPALGPGAPGTVRGRARRAAAGGQRLHGVVRRACAEVTGSVEPDGGGAAGGGGRGAGRRGAGGRRPGGPRRHAAGQATATGSSSGTTPPRTPRCW